MILRVNSFRCVAVGGGNRCTALVDVCLYNPVRPMP